MHIAIPSAALIAISALSAYRILTMNHQALTNMDAIGLLLLAGSMVTLTGSCLLETTKNLL